MLKSIFPGGSSIFYDWPLGLETSPHMINLYVLNQIIHIPTPYHAHWKLYVKQKTKNTLAYRLVHNSKYVIYTVQINKHIFIHPYMYSYICEKKNIHKTLHTNVHGV